MGREEFLGRGVAFPVGTDAAKQFEYAGGETDIQQAIRIIIGTAPGERVMRPRFGCGIHDRVFDSITTTTRGLIKDDVRDALLEWEPRIDIQSVTVRDDPDEGGLLHIEVAYQIRATNTEDNLVYPFYLEGE